MDSWVGTYIFASVFVWAGSTFLHWMGMAWWFAYPVAGIAGFGTLMAWHWWVNR